MQDFGRPGELKMQERQSKRPPLEELSLENKEVIDSWDFVFPSIFLIKTPEITSHLESAYDFCFIFPSWDSNKTIPLPITVFQFILF